MVFEGADGVYPDADRVHPLFVTLGEQVPPLPLRVIGLPAPGRF